MKPTCYHCGKLIAGKAVLTNPPLISIGLGIDFAKAFHPRCYAGAEKSAERAIRNANE